MSKYGQQQLCLLCLLLYVQLVDVNYLEGLFETMFYYDYLFGGVLYLYEGFLGLSSTLFRNIMSDLKVLRDRASYTSTEFLNDTNLPFIV